MKPYIKQAIFIIALYAFFILLRSQSVSLSLSQLLCLPLLLLLVARFNLSGQKIPTSLLLCALALGTLGFVVVENYEESSKRGFFVAKFIGDEMEIESRLFRTELNRLLMRSSDLTAFRYPKLIDNSSALDQVFDQSSKQAMIWGGFDWLAISFPRRALINLETELGQSGELVYPELGKFFVISSTPFFSMSYHPKQATAHFLSSLFMGLLASQANSPTAATTDETTLLYTSSMASTWRSFSHRAFPLFVVGNQYLLDSIDGDVFEPAELKCAFKAYQQALSFLHSARNNPELYGAIINNYAVALLVRAHHKRKRKPIAKARKYLRIAQKVRFYQHKLVTKNRSPAVARKNLKALKSYLEDNRPLGTKQKRRARRVET